MEGKETMIRQRKKILVTMLVFGIAGFFGITLAQNGIEPDAQIEQEKLETLLRRTLDKNLKGYQEEDIEAVMSTIHSESPIFTATKASSQKIFKAYDLNFGILSFSYIGRDTDYVVIRVKQVTTKIAGPEFRDNELDAMHILRKKKGEWKLWQTAILEIKYLDSEERSINGL